MTKEEAIFCEKSYIGETDCRDCNYYATYTCESRESHKMAVKALEKEPCEDTVSREKVWYIMTAGKYSDESYEQFIDRMVEKLNDLPPVIPTREKGKWIEGPTEQGALGIRYTEKTCSKCGWSHSLIIPQNYCPKCGAEMEVSND